MVLYKRKPVLIPPPSADICDDSAETKFICQITGQSKLTFFEALKSERAGAKEVQQAFPESLKGPVLRRVQFQTISRIDHLVDNIYDEFKAEFFPGETVTAQITDSEKVQGTIREKIRVGSKLQADGSMSQPFSRYVINIEDRQNEEVVVDGPAVTRDRKIFTKAVLRTFIKNAVSREAWNGAPWIVKLEFADSYHIDTRVPQHLRYDHKLMQRKQLQAAKRTNQSLESNALADFNNNLNPRRNMHQEPARLPDLKPKSHKIRPQLIANPMTFQSHHSYEPTYVTIPPPPASYMSISLRNNNPPPLRKAPSPPPPVLPKYPIDDLDVGPRAGVVRPKIRFMCNDPPSATSDSSYPFSSSLKMSSIGSLLETWDTLNVYCEIFKLDSFTFDDYVEALCTTSSTTMPQLIEEIHCSVLKILVSSDADGGRVECVLPAEEEEYDEEEYEEEEDDSTMPTPEPDVKPSGRATRSSMAKIEADRLAAEAAAAEKEDTEPQITNRAAELLDEYDWIDSLRKRQFQAGGWQRIIVGLLYQLSRNERKTEACEQILSELVPATTEPTQDTVIEQYALLDVNTKVRILQILCMLTTETKAVRGYMEDCSETMTQYRKEKIEWQRQRKQAIEDLKGLNEQRKALLPENMPPSPAVENEDSKMTDVDSSRVDESENETGEDESLNSSSRKGTKKDDKKKKKKEETPSVKAPKQSKQFVKLLKDIQKKEDTIKQCEKEIAVIDNDLREADCPRTRVLGKDRFWNRYYWFERNGMPYGGLPDSSTASAAYANGCLWIQGPDEMEREGYIDLPTDLQNEYKARFNMTVTERKSREEGDTSVFTASQWGYICDPEDLDKLIHYLDPRGVNEMKLRKELVTFRERIITNMKNRKAYLGIPETTGEPKKEESGEEDKDTKPENSDETSTPAPPSPSTSNANDEDAPKRNGKRSMRLKRQSQTPAAAPEEPAPAPADETPEPVPPRCLKWENTVAIEELGHLHSQPPPPPPPRRKGNNKKRESTVMTEVEEPPRKTRRR
ncbi:uncharacterized protein BROUX77_004661 [Berkeleyomyces rouxiae]|uniref:uncharacterized protein n=1 Tax=Berkeleyomyces rouxiae TaxID=2035830 RepID=UPI003B77DF07